MKCFKKRCPGRLRVVRTCADRGIATQDRECDRCGARKAFTITASEEDVTARTLLKRLLEKSR